MSQRSKSRRTVSGIGIAAAAAVLGASALYGQVTNVQVQATSTQAVISYIAPDLNPCTIFIQEGTSLNQSAPPVHDVDPALFPSSNIDTLRPEASNDGQRRVFVAGKRTAETALDGLRYSRALQTNTTHSYTITCSNGSAVYDSTAVPNSPQLTTVNSPLGSAVNDPLPADPNQPGQYAWPTLNFSDRTQTVVDPHTGFMMKLLDSPRDQYFMQNGPFVSASGSAWTNPGAVTADDTAAATYSGTSRGWLFLELGFAFGNSAGHTQLTSSANAFNVTFNAWCSSSSCATASANDQSIQYCLTVDGVTCATDMLTSVLTACTANCTGSAHRFSIFSTTQAMLADWFPAENGQQSTIDVPALSKRSGNVTRTGANVVWLNGDHFNLAWGAGSSITINGVVYSVSTVNNDGVITLAGSPTGTDVNVNYSASNAGVLVRKLTTGTQQVSVQYASYAYELGGGAQLDPSGDIDAHANCAPLKIPGPGGEQGWHCEISQVLYWIGGDSGKVNRLGSSTPPYNGAANGYGQIPCFSVYWDSIDPNSFYCPINSFSGHVYLVKFTYAGNNTDVGDLVYGAALNVCGGPPCWTINNLTPPGSELDRQVQSFHPAWAAYNFHSNDLELVGKTGLNNSLMFLARRDQVNDTLGFIFKYNLTTQQIDGAIPSWAYWPARWAVLHGEGSLNDPKYFDVSTRPASGSLSGNDFAGAGPWYSTVTSGPISATGGPCPARPGDSPIAPSDWPSGNSCITVTVDGEPGDPSPAYYNGGTISSSGASITGNGTFWTAFMDQSQMQIGSNFYTFSFIDATHGTLDRSPGALSGSAYTIWEEPINNPKVGNLAFSYLQDAAPRDVVSVVPSGGQPYGNGQYSDAGGPEFMRLLIKNGNTWTLQRAWAPHAGVTKPMVAQAAGAEMFMAPSTCYFDTFFPCDEWESYWDFIDDPYGYNASGNTIVLDYNDLGCCHATHFGGVVDLAQNTPARDGTNLGYYSARLAPYPQVFSLAPYLVSANPLFHGLSGMGYPNPVDLHPGHSQSGTATVQENSWIGDARPFLGDDSGGYTGSSSAPGVNLTGTLYKFTAAQTNRLRPRILPTMAACGANTLLDMSGPASLIDGTPATNYKYCIANSGGECYSGSSVGDVYVNCPQTRDIYCSYQGVANSDPDTRDICVGDMGSQTLSLTQVGVAQADPDGRLSRRVSHAFSRYHWLNEFWNVKVTPDGHWMFGWTLFANGLRNSVLLIKLPPFPGPDTLNRGDYVPYQIPVTPTIAGVDNAIVQFGYNPSYFCTSRQDVCIEGSTGTALAPFAYQSEAPSGMPCSNGCTINVPAISQRVMYFQVILRDASNNVLAAMVPQITVVQ